MEPAGGVPPGNLSNPIRVYLNQVRGLRCSLLRSAGSFTISCLARLRPSLPLPSRILKDWCRRIHTHEGTPASRRLHRPGRTTQHAFGSGSLSSPCSGHVMVYHKYNGLLGWGVSHMNDTSTRRAMPITRLWVPKRDRREENSDSVMDELPESEQRHWRSTPGCLIGSTWEPAVRGFLIHCLRL